MMKLRGRLSTFVIGVIVGGGIVFGWISFQDRNRTQIWHAALSELAKNAHVQFNQRGCMDSHLHEELEKYAIMNEHGRWCGVLAREENPFVAVQDIPVCSETK
jgi:predicted negative regulator of RcsB-dependent stress response